MRLTIFARLSLGYLAILLILGAVNGYTLLKLYRLKHETSSIFNIDGRLLDLKKNLTDSLLSQIGHEKKFLITKDPAYSRQFLTENGLFNKYLAEADSIARSLPMKQTIDTIKVSYDQYKNIVTEEFNKTENGQLIQNTVSTEEKETISDQLLDQLKTLEAACRQDMYVRMNIIKDDAAYASKLAGLMLIVALFLVIGTSLASTRSITKPLKALIEKTKEISQGVFEADLHISSPPEVLGLTKAVNVMCDRLKKVDTMKTEFFSAMSHELRTPLTSIKQGIVLLEQGFENQPNEKQKKLLNILSQETNRLIEMVNLLLDLSKMEAGMMPYRFAREELPPLVRKAILEITPIMEAKKIHPRVVFDPDIPMLSLDKERMLQAIRNLISNAVKYTPEGGQIVVSVMCTDHKLSCSFKDTGPGIPKENLNEIFEKFHQLPVKTSEWAKGTGLGLALARNIITAHGGRIWAESVLGQGSTFTFVLPL